MAGEVGLEPTTHRLTADCANQLRYSPILFVTKNVYLVVPTGFEPVTMIYQHKVLTYITYLTFFI